MSGETGTESHPAPADLARFLRGGLPRGEARAVLAHLCSGCVRCRGEVAPLASAMFAPERCAAGPATANEEEAYELPLRRAMAAAAGAALELDRERLTVRQRFAEILERGDKGLPFPARNSSPRHRWAWCEALVEAAPLRVRVDLKGAGALALAGALLADALEGGPFPPRALADLQAGAWVELGNARRAADDLDGADEAMDEAMSRFKAGTRDPLLHARLLDVDGSLYRDQRRFDEAFEALDLLYRLCAHLGEWHLAGRALVNKGVALIHAARPEEAVACLERGLALIDEKREPHLLLSTFHNLIHCHTDLGQFFQARSLLRRTRPLYEVLGSSLQKMKARWVEAKIAAGLGQPSRAERLFREVKAKLEDEGLAYDGALAALELASLLLEQNRPAEVLDLVDEVHLIFLERRIHREALASLIVLRQALAQGEATVALVRTTIEAIERAGEAARQAERDSRRS